MFDLDAGGGWLARDVVHEADEIVEVMHRHLLSTGRTDRLDAAGGRQGGGFGEDEMARIGAVQGEARADPVEIAHSAQNRDAIDIAAGEPGALVDEDQLIDWACDRLARYKCPTKVLFVDELPRNVSGKLVRRSLV